MVRFKNRYLLVEVDPCFEGAAAGSMPAGSFSPSAIAALLRDSLETNFGITAAAKAQQAFSVKYANAGTRMVILRTARDMLEEVWASLCLLSTLSSGGDRWRWRVVQVAGTIRSCHQAAIRHARRRLKTEPSAQLVSQIQAIEA